MIILTGQGEKHIPPHHGLEAVPAADVHHPFQMAIHDVDALAFAKELSVPSQPQIGGFIHADVDPLSAKSLAAALDHLLDQRVSGLIIRQQNIVDVPQLGICVPAQRRIEMSQGLDAGDHLHPEFRRVRIQLAQLLPIVSSPHIAEIGLSLHLVCVLGVQHQGVMPHQRQRPDQLLHRVEIQHRVAGAVRHHPIALESRILLQPEGLLRFMLRRQPQRPEEISPFRAGDHQPIPFPADRQARPLPTLGHQLHTLAAAVHAQPFQNFSRRPVRADAVDFQMHLCPSFLFHKGNILNITICDFKHTVAQNRRPVNGAAANFNILYFLLYLVTLRRRFRPG